jgi:uncharacterized membrane protein
MFNFYLYSVTSITLTAFYTGAVVLVNGLLRLWLGVDTSEATLKSIAIGTGLVTVAFPSWWLHWRWLKLQFDRAQGTAVAWHRFYLFTIICLNAMAILIGGSIGVANLMGVALNISDAVAKDVATAGIALFVLLLSIGLWRHHWGQFKGGMGELLPRAPAPSD